MTLHHLACKKVFRWSLAIAIAATVVLVAGLAYVKISVHGKFPPKTFVAGVDISNQNFAQAQVLLEKKGSEYASAKIPVIFEGKKYQLAVKDIAPKLYIDETLNTIKETDGRDFGVMDLFIPRDYEEKNSAIISNINEEQTWLHIDKFFQLTALEPASATFFFEAKGQLQITPEHEGVVIDRKTLSKSVKSRIENLSTEPVNIEAIAAKPAVTSAVLASQKAKVLEKLQHNVTLEDPIYSDDWNLKLKDHLDWVTFSAGENYCLPVINATDMDCSKESLKEVRLKLKPQPFNAYIDSELSKWLDKPAEDVVIKPGENGKADIQGEGGDGKLIQRESLRKALELAVENDVSKITIPVISIAPKVTIDPSLKEKGIKEKLAVGHTSYYGSPGNRVFNIKVASAKLNGILIAPGEEFSFNDALGNVDGSTGYRKELVIKKEGTIPEYGGGVCQVSTTFYRAALFSGLPIEERNEHSYAVSYYSQILGHGLDATIYIGGPNLRFTNDTGHYVLMQAYVNPDFELYVVFYGTKDGRNVEMEGPYISNKRGAPATVYEETDTLAPGQTKESEHAHPGFSVLWYRYLTDKDGKTITEEIKTNYKAMPAKILVGKAAAAEVPAIPEP